VTAPAQALEDGPRPWAPVISLQEHFEKINAERDKRYDHVAVERDKRYDELAVERELRAQQLEVERDLRYQQRWQAQNQAVDAAFLAAKEAIAAALLAAEKAVIKAETASNRFSDEFRTALSDFTANQVPRPEYQAGIANVTSRVDDMERRLTEKIDQALTYQAASTGKSSGISVVWVAILGGASLLFGAIATVSAIVAVLG